LAEAVGSSFGAKAADSGCAKIEPWQQARDASASSKACSSAQSSTAPASYLALRAKHATSTAFLASSLSSLPLADNLGICLLATTCYAVPASSGRASCCVCTGSANMSNFSSGRQPAANARSWFTGLSRIVGCYSPRVCQNKIWSVIRGFWGSPHPFTHCGRCFQFRYHVYKERISTC